MSAYSGEHRAFILESFFKLNDSYIGAIRAYRSRFKIPSHVKVPTRCTVRKWVSEFRARGSTDPKKKPGAKKSARTPQAIEKVKRAFQQSPTRSIVKHAAALKMTPTTVRRILHQDLKKHPYKISLAQELKPEDYADRKSCALKLLSKVEAGEIPLHRILMTDEAHFHLSGVVNKQNMRFWATENPHIVHEKPLHSPKVTVWLGIASYGIVGPYFFQESNETVTVNKVRYIKMLREFLIPELKKRRKLSQTWFQQDGATAHTANETLTVLRAAFANRIISRRTELQWPARSPDLTAPDFFVWGYLKSVVYGDKPRTLNDLKKNICSEIRKITPALCKRVLENFVERLRQCVASNGQHLPHVLFQK